MLSFLFSCVFYTFTAYGAVKLVDNILTTYYTEKLRLLKQEYKEVIEEEPNLDPLYNVTRELTFYYYRLGLCPAWQLTGSSYLLYTYYNQYKVNLEWYCEDDFFDEEEEDDQEDGDWREESEDDGEE